MHITYKRFITIIFVLLICLNSIVTTALYMVVSGVVMPALAYTGGRYTKSSMVYNPNYYTDIKGNWAEQSLRNAAMNGILSGTSSTTMSPSRTLTRAQMSAMLVRIFNPRSNGNLSSYLDVDSRAWYYPELSRAVGMGIIQGYGNYIYPDAPITRQEACALLTRAFKLQARSNKLGSYYDYNSVAQWAQDGISACDAIGALKTVNYNINPTQPITRAEFASMIYSIVQDFDTSQVNSIGNYNISAIITNSSSTYNNLHLRGNLYIACPYDTVNLASSYINGTVVMQDGDLTLKSNTTVSNLVVDDCDTDILISTDHSSKVTDITVKDCKGKVKLSGYYGTVRVNSSTTINIEDAVIGTLIVQSGVNEDIHLDYNSIIDTYIDSYGRRESSGKHSSSSEEFPITSYMSPMKNLVVSVYNPITLTENYNVEISDLISDLEMSSILTDNVLEIDGTLYNATIDGVKGYYLPLRFTFTGVEEDFSVEIDNQTISSTRGYSGSDIRLNILLPVHENRNDIVIYFKPVEGSKYNAVTLAIHLKDTVKFR